MLAIAAMTIADRSVDLIDEDILWSFIVLDVRVLTRLSYSTDGKLFGGQVRGFSAMKKYCVILGYGSIRIIIFRERIDHRRIGPLKLSRLGIVIKHRLKCGLVLYSEYLQLLSAIVNVSLT